MKEKIFGIIGGMGAMASANFYLDLTKRKNVKKDQEHLHLIIDSNTKIADRTTCILENKNDAKIALLNSAKMLKNANCDYIALTCITAHYYIDFLKKNIDTTFLNTLELTKDYIYHKILGNKNIDDNDSTTKKLLSNTKIGILCTTGTKKVQIFDKYIKDFQIIYPSDNIQENYVMSAIYGNSDVLGIKNNNKNLKVEKDLLKRAAISLINSGANVLIFGCTEIPLVLNNDDFSEFDVITINPLDILANKILELDK